MDNELLRRSFELVVSRNPEPTVRFYEILFERHPELQALFGANSREQQAAMLRDALVAVLDHLEDAPWLAETLRGIGAKHVDYGVTPEMYPYVGEALLATFAEIAADDWTEPVATAWQQAYDAIQEGMLAGASAAAATG